QARTFGFESIKPGETRMILHWFRVETSKKEPQMLVELLDRIENDVADLLIKLALNDADSGFDRSLITRLIGPCRKNGKSHVVGKLCKGSIDLGIVEVRACDGRLQVINDNVWCDATESSECALNGWNERGLLLIEKKLRFGS